jgi:hypothetical protein
VRTPNAPMAGLPNAPAPADIAAGRALFSQAGCVNCHGGQNWTISFKDFISPPGAGEGVTLTERTGTFTGNPVGAQYVNRFLRDIGSFNLGVPGQGNLLGNNVGADEKAAPTVVNGALQLAQDALGRDYNSDGRGIGYNVPSLLGIYAVPPFLHNGAAESLAQVVADVKHRTANGTLPDLLTTASDQARVVAFLESLDVATTPFVAATLSSPAYPGNNQFQFDLTGQAGASYVIQASTNLAGTNWISLRTNAAPFTFVESNAVLYPLRSYRALFLP